MGEIGLPRREFLYDIQFWEARRIIRGYQRRNILHYQLLRMNMWASMFCMGNPNHKQPQDILPLYFDDWDNDEDGGMPISEEEKQELVDLMNRMNEQQTTPADESADKKQE